MVDVSKIGNEGVWRNEGYVETIKPLQGSEYHAVTVEHVPVTCAYDPNLSSSFQMRHVVDPEGHRGFTCYVDGRFPYLDTYREGTTQEAYDESKKVGEAYMQEALRRHYLESESRARCGRMW